MAVGLAGALAAALHDQGAYAPGGWAPLGAGCLVVAGAGLAAGRRPARAAAVGAALLAAVGGWAALSTLWGGLPGAGWESLDRFLVAAAALVAGAVLGDGRVVAAGVLGAETLLAGDVLVGVATGGAKAPWFADGLLDGPVGYHNAQAAACAIGLPLALAACAASLAAAALLVGALLLTESRGGLGAAAVGVAVVVVLDRTAAQLLRALSLGVAAALLFLPLRTVDAALQAEGAAAQAHALRVYVGWVLAAAAGLAVVGAVELRPSRRLRLAAAAAAAAALAVSVVGVASADAVGAVRLALTRLDAQPTWSPGETRLTAISFNGRLEAWRIAAGMVTRDPVVGGGTGSYARAWARERTTSGLYMLQPHSIELELLAELGAVGLVAFAAGIAVPAVALRRRGGPVAAAALGALAALLLQASFDWTWSFPALVAPVLLLVGAALGTRIGGARHGDVLRSVGAGFAAAAVGALLLGPYLAARDVARAGTVARRSPDAAWRLADAATRADPWDAEALALHGRLAEAGGRYVVAAEWYDRAAAVSLRPWVDRFRAARALAAAGDRAGAARACRVARAENPLEPMLRRDHCGTPDP